jgi:hypothetical protein
MQDRRNDVSIPGLPSGPDSFLGEKKLAEQKKADAGAAGEKEGAKPEEKAGATLLHCIHVLCISAFRLVCVCISSRLHSCTSAFLHFCISALLHFCIACLYIFYAFLHCISVFMYLCSCCLPAFLQLHVCISVFLHGGANFVKNGDAPEETPEKREKPDEKKVPERPFCICIPAFWISSLLSLHVCIYAFQYFIFMHTIFECLYFCIALLFVCISAFLQCSMSAFLQLHSCISAVAC